MHDEEDEQGDILLTRVRIMHNIIYSYYSSTTTAVVLANRMDSMYYLCIIYY